MDNAFVEKDNILRKILPIRNVGHNSLDSSMIRISNSFGIEYYEKIKDYEKYINSSYKRLYNSEMFLFVNGSQDLELEGINNTRTTRNNLDDAIKEFNPDGVLTSNVNLELDEPKVFHSAFVPENTYFLIRKDPEIAEFIISEDITININKLDVDVSEWVMIDIHDVDKIIKVVVNN